MPGQLVKNRTAITLVELLVVLVVLGLASALVAPALLFPEDPERRPYDAVLDGVVDLAAAREEVLRLVVEPDGRWRVAASPAAEVLARGRIDAYQDAGFVLLVSPLGSCGPAPGSAPPFALEPLTCTVP
jgi:ABC-type cobalamin transport system permease subunit